MIFQGSKIIKTCVYTRNFDFMQNITRPKKQLFCFYYVLNCWAVEVNTEKRTN